MKHSLTLLILITCSLSVFAASGNSIKFCDDPFPPYTWEREDGTIEGPSISFLKEVFTRLQIPLTLETYPWKRLMLHLKSGECDGVNFLLSNDDRRKFSHYSVPIHDGSAQCIMSVSNREKFPKAVAVDFEWLDLSNFSYKAKNNSLEYLKVGKVRGYIYGDQFDQAVKDGKIKIYETLKVQQSVKMLVAGRLPLIIMNLEVFNEQIKSLGQGLQSLDFNCSGKTFATPPYYLVISKKSKFLKNRTGLLKEINSVITLIKRENKHTVQAYLINKASSQK